MVSLPLKQQLRHIRLALSEMEAFVSGRLFLFMIHFIAHQLQLIMHYNQMTVNGSVATGARYIGLSIQWFVIVISVFTASNLKLKVSFFIVRKSFVADNLNAYVEEFEQFLSPKINS